MVIADEAGEHPIRRALVSMTAGGQGSSAAADETVVTDDAGRFVFPSVTPGRHTLTAAKPGYVTTSFGASRPGRAGTPIQLARGQQLQVTIRLARGAVVTGSVRDQDGEPLASGRVALMKYVFQAQTGARALQSTPWSAVSDDRGRYRIYGVTPGSYVAQLGAPSRCPAT
jgi:Protocatechuate 3,4-dioxygenase beta subunit